MGAELDSLCDLVDFGVAPCLVVYTWYALAGWLAVVVFSHPFCPRLRYTTPEGAKTSVPDEVVWLSCLVFVCCCAFRLARFNLTDANAPKAIVEAVKSGEIGEDAVDDDDADAAAAKEEEPVPVPVAKKDSLHKRIGRSVVNRVSKSSASRRGMKLINDYITKKKFFQGVPAPMAGALALTPMVFSFQYGAYLPDPHLTVVATMLTVGGLMVSTLPTLSSKMLMRNPRKESHLKSRSIFSLLFKVAFVGAVIFAVVTVPWYFYLVCSLLYVIILPVSPFIHYLSE